LLDVSLLQIIGTIFMLLGVAALPLFRILGRDRPGIARRHTLLDTGALVAIVLGGLFYMAGW
jgi:hypothetical protein